MRSLLICLFVLTIVVGCERAEDSSAPDTVRISNELVKKAHNGDLVSQYELGKQKIRLKSEESVKEGFSWISRAATNGLAKAQCYVGASYFKGEIVEHDSYEAKKWLGKAVENGDAIACRILGYMKYEEGDISRALDFFNMGESRGDAISAYYIARLLLCENPSFDISLFELTPWLSASQLDGISKQFKSAAEKGCAAAKYDHIYVMIVRKMFDEVEKELSLQDSEEDARIMCLQGMYCLAEENPKRDDKLGVKWLSRAADAGDVTAMRMLAHIKWNGTRGVEQDRSAAMSLLERATESGDQTSRVRIAYAWTNEKNGRSIDVERAVKLYEDAGMRGSLDAQSRLAAMYYLGDMGLEVNVKKALKWAKRAAANGDAIGEYIVGISYIKGENCAVDYEKAIEWLRRAKTHGSRNASDLLNALKEKGWKITE